MTKLRIAFVGKGGAGKSAIVGTFARLLARTGEPVLVLDTDPMPGLALTLGVSPSDAGAPDEAVVEAPEGERPRFRLREGLTAVDAVERYATRCPDGVRLLQIGKLRGHVASIERSQAAYHHIKAGLAEDDYHIIGDLPGGTRQAFFGWGDFARTVLVVVRPTVTSILSGRRLARLAGMASAPRVLAVVNGVTAAGDAEEVGRRTGLPVLGAVPLDEAFADAERAGRAPLDAVPNSPSVEAIASLLDAVRSEEALV